MNNILLFMSVLLSKNILKTIGQETIQPYGPKMCDVLFERTKGCSDYRFDKEQLSCHLAFSVPNSNLGCGKAKDSTGLTTASSQPDLAEPMCLPDDVEDLHEACEEGNLEVVKQLVCRGKVGVNCADDQGLTAIMCSEKNREIFDFLVHEHADVSARSDDGFNVLHFACQSGSLYIIKTLLDDKKMDIECETDSGESPLALATFGGHVAAVKLLKDRGADLEAVNGDHETILHYAAAGGHIDMVSYVLSLKICDIESRGRNGETPVLVAAKAGSIALVKLLLKEGANLTSTSDIGRNVLHAACFSYSKRMFKYLLSLNELKGYERMKDSNDMTPVQLAKFRSRIDIESLIKSGNH